MPGLAEISDAARRNALRRYRNLQPHLDRRGSSLSTGLALQKPLLPGAAVYREVRRIARRRASRPPAVARSIAPSTRRRLRV